MTDENETRELGSAPKRKASFVPEKSAEVGAANNMNAERLAPMTFNMPKSWHLEFKVEAATRGISMKELMVDCFAAYNKQKAK